MIKYYKLFDILNRKGFNKTDLIEIAGLTSPTIAKLSKGAVVTTETIDKICKGLSCQPGDIMEYTNEWFFQTTKDNRRKLALFYSGFFVRW